MSERTYYIETYGCQMNEHDSEKMSAMLETMGLTRSTSPKGAEVVVVNTCAIREKAEHKVYSALGNEHICRDQRWKWIHRLTGAGPVDEVYDLVSDPGEARNISDQPEGEDVRQRFRPRLQDRACVPRRAGVGCGSIP